MPWFHTSIAVERDSIENPSLNVKTHRCFGFQTTYNEAYRAVMENRCNMVECLYDYHVLEYIEPGIHPMVHSEVWFQYDEMKNGWIECDKPEGLKTFTNWALG